MTVEQIKNDQNLRPLFLELISRNQVCNLMEIHSVRDLDRIRMVSELKASLATISEALRPVVKEEDILETVAQVCRLYTKIEN